MNAFKYMCRYGILIVWPVLGLLIMTGCAAKGHRADFIKVNLVHIKAREVKLFETALIVELRIFNVSDVPIDIKGAECQIDINGKKFAFGVSNRKLEIPAFETATIPIKVFSSVIDMVKNLINLTDEQALEYKVAGRLHLENKIQHMSTIGFESEGRLFSKEISR